MLANPAPARSAPPDELIEQCLRGDQIAWEAIVRQYWRRVFNIAYKFVGRHDEAEDLTQDVFLKIFKALKTFDRRANFQMWLISVSRNLCIDHYRSVRKERESVDAGDLSLTSGDIDPLTALERSDRRAFLQRAMNRDRGEPRGPAPPTPPCVRVRTRRFGWMRVHRVWCSLGVRRRAPPGAIRSPARRRSGLHPSRPSPRPALAGFSASCRS